MYEKIVTFNHPILILIGLDTSSSMSEQIGSNNQGKPLAKFEMLREALNLIQDDFVLKSRGRKNEQEIIHNLFDICGYTFGGKVRNLYEKELVTASDIDKGTEMVLHPNGLTPMGQAAKLMLHKLDELLATGKYNDSYPPIVFFLSDGHFTDETPVPYLQEMQKRSVKDGNVLVVTVFFSPEITGGSGCLFCDEDPKWSPDAKTLFQSASIVPDPVPKNITEYLTEVKINGQNFKVSPGDHLFFTVSELPALIAVLGIVGSSMS